jgi:hypothetical protein
MPPAYHLPPAEWIHGLHWWVKINVVRKGSKRLNSLFPQYLKAVPALAVALVIGIGLAFVVFRITRWINARHPNQVRTAALRRLRGPIRSFIPLLLMLASLHYVKVAVSAEVDIRHAISLLLVGSAAWGLARLVEAVEDAVLYYYHIDSVDNLKARRLQTQIRVFRRIIVVVWKGQVWFHNVLWFHNVFVYDP